MDATITETVPMRYTIKCDLPGRLRIRYGKLAFTKEEGYGIATSLLSLSGVSEVTTATQNGSVLIQYDKDQPDCRTSILEALKGFDRYHLPVGEASESQSRAEIDSKFQNDIIGLIGAHFARKFFLPAPLRIAWTLWRSLHFIKLGLQHLWKGELSVEVLDATAITASMITGAWSSAGSVMLLLTISDRLEEYTHARSRIALEQSLALNVDDVWLVEDGKPDVKVPMSSIKKDDAIRVRTGAMVPVDGTVLEGEAALNEASMTGESRLVTKEAGKSVFAGTVVEEGELVVRVRNAGDDTRISRIVSMVDESEKLKAGVQSRAERLADAIVPYNLLAFILVGLITRNVTKAMAVLMVDYSCAIKLSTPVAIMSAMREAANRGMIVKGGRYMETMAEADTIIFDKTGTLTTATPKVEKVIPLGERSEDETLRLAACLEEHFPHSMARAVMAEANRRGLYHPDELHADVKYLVAHGIASTVNGKHAVIGSAHFVFEDEGVELPEGLSERIKREAPGCSVIYLAVDNKLEGAICITDPVRPEAVDTIKKLREAGFKNIVMLTGDSENAAHAAAKKLGITQYRSQVLPEDKASVIDEYKAKGHKVVMVGDGVNDSPALAKADVSLAMVDATDIAREVADITLLDSSLDEILEVRELSQKLMKRIDVNYRFIVVFNTALIVLGVASILQPTTSALLHNASTMAITARNMTSLLDEARETAED